MTGEEILRVAYSV